MTGLRGGNTNFRGDLKSIEKGDQEILLELLQEKEHRAKRRKLYSYFPEKGPLRRELYVKHMKAFEATKEFNQVWMMAGNRTGKTESFLAYAITCFATGIYPEWWPGRKWNRPIKAWLASTTGTKTRDVLQKKLLGEANERGTGLIPGETIVNTTAKSGISEAVDTLYVRHISGGVSVIQFKSYDQGRKAFEGAEQDIIGLDEEPPLDVYEECAIRTMTTQGIMLAAFTPLEGITELIANEFPEGTFEEGKTANGKFMVSMTWDDVPHLSEDDKERLWNTIAPHLRDARKKGIPLVGSGLIYPYSQDDYICKPFAIPEGWRKAYGFDVGWNFTAAIFGAIDPNNGTWYLYDEHLKEKSEPAIHASAIHNRGRWMPGLVDPASRGRSQIDGRKLLDVYRAEGLDLHLAKNARESGFLKVGQGLTTGKIKVFSTLTHFFREIRMYRRDEDGQVIKTNDHVMDATRYLIVNGEQYARISPVEARRKLKEPEYTYSDGGWMSI